MINIAVLGHGTVGSGVVELILMNQKHIEAKLAQPLYVKYVLDVRDFPESPYPEKFIKDFSIIEKDPEIKVVAEVIGGVNVAYDFTVRSLKAGKSVVTSNKELVAQKGYELLQLAKKYNVNYFFEASVGGGIPLIRPMHRCMAANEITEFYGILNGTTNFILTKMVEDGMSFDGALKLAQKLGYAEANPTADVDGIDACRKMCILSSLAFGHHVYPKDVYAEGIRNISPDDVAIAKKNGYEIKLIGQAKQLGDKIKVMVSPALVPGSCLLAQVKDVFNGVLLKGNAVGDVFLYGRGAGKFPTASAVVADILDAAKHFEFLKGWGWEDEICGQVLTQEELETAYFVRVKGTASDILSVYGNARILFEQENTAAAITPILSNAQHSCYFKELSILSAIRVIEV